MKLKLGQQKMVSNFQKLKLNVYTFVKLRRMHAYPKLHIYGTQIPVVKEAKFLGLIFDHKLSFIPHIKTLKAKCLKALDILSPLSFGLGRRSDSPFKSLQNTYKIQIRLRIHCLWIC